MIFDFNGPIFVIIKKIIVYIWVKDNIEMEIQNNRSDLNNDNLSNTKIKSVRINFIKKYLLIF